MNTYVLIGNRSLKLEGVEIDVSHWQEHADGILYDFYMVAGKEEVLVFSSISSIGRWIRGFGGMWCARLVRGEAMLLTNNLTGDGSLLYLCGAVGEEPPQYATFKFL